MYRSLLFLLSLLFIFANCQIGKAIDVDTPENSKSLELSNFVGKRINKVFIVSEMALNGELEKHIRSLEGKRFNLIEVQKTIDWLYEAMKDTKLDIFVKEVSSEVEININIQSHKKISKLDFEGNKNIDSSDLIAITGLRENEDLTEDDIKSAKTKIDDYLKNNGFFNAVTSYTINDTEVKFFIKENEITRVNEVSISQINMVSDKNFKNLLEKSALSAFGVKKGERFSRKKIGEGILRLKDWLRNRDFILAKEPIVNSSILDNGKIANLDIQINYGPRIHFGFRNNERFSNKELTAFLLDIQDVSIGSDYLETVKSRVKDAYSDVGLVNATVDTQITEDPKRGYKYVSILVAEGKRIRIDKIQIDGVYSIPQEELIDLFLSFSSKLVQRFYFQQKGLESAANQLAEHLRAKGFLSARFDLMKLHFDEKRKKVEVDLYFSEGIQTTVNEIRILGANNISTQEIQSLLQINPGKPFDVYTFEKGINQVKEKYRNLGYLNADIINNPKSIVTYTSDQSQANVYLEINEGLQMRVGEVFVRGNKQTHARVVTRELPFEKGDILTEQLQNEAEENLRKLNLFSSVVVRNIERPGSNNIRDIVVLVEEAIPGVIEMGPGFRNDLGLRFYIGASYQNLGGWHRGINSRIIVNRRLDNFKFFEYNMNIGFREPYFAGLRVTLLNNLYFLRRIFSSFDATINKATSELRKNLTKNVTGLLQYSFEYVKVYNAKEVRDNKITRIGAITPGMIFDTRNDIFNPSGGFFSVNRLEIASSSFASQNDVGYYRATSNNTTYFGLAPDLVWSFAINYGFERSNVKDKEIPKIKLFRLGGTSTIRGYQEEALEVDGQNVIKGTLSMLNYRSELRFPLDGDFGGALFWDAGNLYIDRVQPFRLRHSTGVGLRYKTPVGPISLDFARKLGAVGYRGDRVNTDDQDTQRIHFSIGSF